MLTLVVPPRAPGARPAADAFDVRAAWQQLTDEQRQEIGVAAIVQALGSIAMDRHLDPFDVWDLAAIEGQDKLEEAVVAHVVGGSTTLPRPDLAAIGVRSCERCGWHRRARLRGRLRVGGAAPVQRLCSGSPGMSATTINWTEYAVATLRRLWAEDHSAAEIGRRMNTSKNAIVGKAHRLGLPSRPSPVVRLGEKRPRCVPVAGRVTLPSLVLPPPAAVFGAPSVAPDREPERPAPHYVPAHGRTFHIVTPEPLIPVRTDPPPVRAETKPVLTCSTIVMFAVNRLEPPTLCPRPRDGKRPFCAECAARFYVKRIAPSLAVDAVA